MVLDASLKQAVISFVGASNATEAAGFVQTILWRWAGVELRASDGVPYLAEARWLYMLEALTGTPYTLPVGSLAGPNKAGDIYAASQDMFDRVFSQLASQSHLKSLFDQLTVSWDPVAGRFGVDASAAATSIASAVQSDRASGLRLLSEFISSLAGADQLTTPLIATLHSTLDGLGSDVAGILYANPWSAFAN